MEAGASLRAIWSKLQREAARKPITMAASISGWKGIDLAPCFGLVQFAGVPSDLLPRLYLATPKEMAQRMHETAKGRGDTILYENQQWTARAHGAGTVDKIPDDWRFTRERVEELIENDDVSVTTSQTLT